MDVYLIPYFQIVGVLNFDELDVLEGHELSPGNFNSVVKGGFFGQ